MRGNPAEWAEGRGSRGGGQREGEEERGGRGEGEEEWGLGR